MSDDNGKGDTLQPGVNLNEDANHFYLVTWYWTVPGAGGFSHAPFFTPKPLDSARDLGLLESSIRKLVKVTDQNGAAVILQPQEIGVTIINLIHVREPRVQVQMLEFPSKEDS